MVGCCILSDYCIDHRGQHQTSQQFQPSPFQQPGSNSVQFYLRELIEGEHLPGTSEAGLQQLHPVPLQQSGCNSELLQIVNLQGTSHSQAPIADTPLHSGEEHPPPYSGVEPPVSTANSLEVLRVELPTFNFEEEPSLSYYGEEPPPPYSTEEPPLPFTGEEPPSYYSREEPPSHYSREELPSPLSGEELLPPYNVTTLV